MSRESLTDDEANALELSKQGIKARKKLRDDYLNELDRRRALAKLRDPAAHLWLAEERWSARIRRTYELGRNPNKAKCHWRIAALLNNRYAFDILSKAGDDDLGAANLPQSDPRTAWLGGEITPSREGLYEVEQSGKVAYAIWQDGYWSEDRKHVGQLLDELHVGTLSFEPSMTKLPWRGLASDPLAQPKAYWPVGPSLRAGVRIDAIIAHDDNASPVDTVLHLARRSKPVEHSFVAICGVAPHSGKARIWNLGPQLKVLKGQPSRICEQCEALARDVAADIALFPPPVAHADTPARRGSSNADASGSTANAGTSGPAGAILNRIDYCGAIAYDIGSPTAVEKFHILDDRRIDVQLYSTPDDAMPTQFILRGRATRNAAGLFETPFISITHEDGSLYPGYHVSITFTVLEQNAEWIKIAGKWLDDKTDNAYSFFAILLPKPPDISAAVD
jgi:hypothetical protein